MMSSKLFFPFSLYWTAHNKNQTPIYGTTIFYFVQSRINDDWYKAIISLF